MNRTKLLLTFLMMTLAFALAGFKPISASIPPVIDGELNDACWKEAQFYSEFYTYNTDQRSPLKAEFAVAYTETNVVFAFRCLDTPSPKQPEPADMKLLFKECVEVMLDPTGGKDTYFHFAVGRNGALYDRKCEQGGFLGNKEWKSHFEAKVKLQENSWTCELAVPYKALELREGGAKEWSFNVTRESTELASIAKNGAFNVAGSFRRLPAPDFDLRPYSWEISPVTSKLQISAKKYAFTLNGEIVNHTGQDASVNVTSTLIGPGGVTAFVVNPNVKVPNDKSTKYATTKLQGGDSGVYKMVTQIRDAVNGRILSEREDEILAQYQPLSIRVISPSYRNAIFATQKLENMICEIGINLPKKELEGVQLKYWHSTEDGGNVIFQGDATPGTDKVRFSCPNSKLPEGKIIVNASLTSKDGKPLGTASDVVRKLPYHKNEVFRGDDGNWYIDGKKTFLLLAWNSQHAHQPGYVASMPKGDNNLGMSGLGFGLTSSGFKARYYKEGWTDYCTDFFTKRIQGYMKDENVFAHYWLDEPDCGGWSREFATRVAKLAAEIDPWHPVVISTGTQGVTSYPDSGELNGFHCYPSPRVDKPMANFVKIVACLDKYNREKVNFERPQDIVYLHQGFNYGDVGNKNTRVPSYEEYRNQNFLALAMGCTGILHYNRIGVPYPELITGMRELTKEQKIVGEHAIIQQPVPIASPVPELKLRAFKNENDGSFWIIAVYAKDGEATLEIPAPQNGTWQVLSEKRSIDAKNGKIKDSFTAYQTHIYTTDKTDYKLMPVDEIVKAIDAEYEARRKPGNLAYQRRENQVLAVTASSNHYHRQSSFAKDTCLWHVTDGVIDNPHPDLNLQSYCDATPKQLPDWVALTFHKPVTAKEILVYPEKASLCDFEVQISKDGQNWTCVKKFEDAKGVCHIAKFAPQEIKAVRIFVTKNNGPNTRIAEIEVY
ncbi:MAG: discoidin domain-containing protein [Victivallales bacterium]|nr:discoidin domain-containing protein [Victivallales bacterium]